MTHYHVPKDLMLEDIAECEKAECAGVDRTFDSSLKAHHFANKELAAIVSDVEMRRRLIFKRLMEEGRKQHQ